MLTLNWKKAERAYGSQPWCREEISMGMRYDGEKQEPGKRNNVIIVALCIAILILTFMLFIINISRLRNLFSSDNRKRPTENTQGSNVVMSGPADGEEPQAGGEDDSVGANPAEEEEPVEEAAEEPAEEEEEEEAVEGEEEDSEADNIIAFADPVFKDAVRRALRITDKDVRVRDTYGVRSLLLENNSADNSKIIDDLTGLADFRDLKELKVSGYQILDISSLAGLQLTKLELQENMIRDISPLRDMTSLEYLDLHHNGISDLTPLQNLTRLRTLWLHENMISDLTPLKGLSSLRNLYLSTNNISDISPLGSLTGLTGLTARANNIKDISPLSNLVNLDWLYLCQNKISNLSPLQNLTRLTELYVNDNKVSDLSALRNLTNLKKLELRGNSIRNISALSGLDQLRVLDLRKNQIKDFSPVSHLGSDVVIK